ncbi:hypothetical protein BJX64DRAFT_72777 [Aspergillus heterothallicus]
MHKRSVHGRFWPQRRPCKAHDRSKVAVLFVFLSQRPSHRHQHDPSGTPTSAPTVVSLPSEVLAHGKLTGQSESVALRKVTFCNRAKPVSTSPVGTVKSSLSLQLKLTIEQPPSGLTLPTHQLGIQVSDIMHVRTNRNTLDIPGPISDSCSSLATVCTVAYQRSDKAHWTDKCLYCGNKRYTPRRSREHLSPRQYLRESINFARSWPCQGFVLAYPAVGGHSGRKGDLMRALDGGKNYPHVSL